MKTGMEIPKRPRMVVFTLLLVVGVAGCSESKVALDESDLRLASATGIPQALLQKAKSEGNNLRRLEGRDDGGNPTPAPGVTIDVPQDEAHGVLARIKRAAPAGYVVFISERNFGIGGEPDYVSILKADSDLDALKVMGTNGWNYDISPEMVIRRIEEWDKRYGLVVVGVGFDWFEAEFRQAPANMMEFAAEVYEFCPDVVEQGTGSVEALAKEMKKSNKVYLWWD